MQFCFVARLSLVPQKGLLPVTMLTTKIYDEFTNVSFDYSFGSVFSSLLVIIKSWSLLLSQQAFALVA